MSAQPDQVQPSTLSTESPAPSRRIFCNRTLNLRSIGAIGYDMDYTLVHYRPEPWERRAYERLRAKLSARGWPLTELRFDPDLVTQGLVVDTERGNVVKADRFGYIKHAVHGTQPMTFEERRTAYAQERVDLSESRWSFLNTLFSLSEGCLYLQVVDLLDRKLLPAGIGYRDLYQQVRAALDEAHMEGELKADILADPERYIELDPLTTEALLDQKRAGKKLVLITNSEWPYTRRIMSYAFDRFLPGDETWRTLFDLVIVSAGKPGFFAHRQPFFEVVDEEGLLRPFPRALHSKGVFFGGNARLLEEYLGLTGQEILYVGDHIYGDVHVSKSILRWRTALILRDLEKEVDGIVEAAPLNEEIARLMVRKEELEMALAKRRIRLLREKEGEGASASRDVLRAQMDNLAAKVASLDDEIAPLAKRASEVGNTRWGPLLRTGNDKSRLARQVERYADIYTSRVSNFYPYTPFMYLRAPRGSLPHDPAG